MNKLAWSFLKNSSKGEKLEDTLDRLLIKKYEDYNKIAGDFDTLSKKSRKYLSLVLPEVYQILNSQLIEDSVYSLNKSDLLLIALYAENYSSIS